eukprot:gnl/MRDRNA2_/MRDRNA2_58324_c0_seq1.p1 gnl/MRDRNA2_/MRDRNA2_58324_c0~~gnl/MRDRNA2_/MRDRNA2_58324_c0_seq1.p1  ORF type:complete len:109 (-),score=16.87 gnl/MRDRNA2_/MRDRNA2_58324_c0_seq1:352-678(-)
MLVSLLSDDCHARKKKSASWTQRCSIRNTALVTGVAAIPLVILAFVWRNASTQSGNALELTQERSVTQISRVQRRVELLLVPRKKPQVEWADGVVDNEHLNRKKVSSC